MKTITTAITLTAAILTGCATATPTNYSRGTADRHDDCQIIFRAMISHSELVEGALDRCAGHAINSHQCSSPFLGETSILRLSTLTKGATSCLNIGYRPANLDAEMARSGRMSRKLRAFVDKI